jgi:hypothetical protein
MRPSVAVAFSLLLFGGCGGRSVSLEGGEAPEPDAGSRGSSAGRASGGSSGEGPGGSSGGSPATGSGGNGDGNQGGGSSAGAPTGTGGSPGSNDPNCYPGLAVSGAECSEDCSVPCGLGELGTRTCTCTGGYYSSCHCPRPPGYLGAPTAPPCDTPDGRALPLRHEPCNVEWAQCIGSDPVEGSIPRGCACLKNPLNGDELTWFCGSTSRWFSPE